MTDMLETKKYTFTVEGETERWYLLWLRDRINEQKGKEYKVAIEAKVQQHPMKFAKGVNAISTPAVVHICDVESKTAIHVEKFRGILNELKAAKTEKKPSIRAQLKAAKEQTPKKQAKQKTQDLERS